jgi:DeoR family transcriptional regulator, glycerol-3-phosphate regulon repressor
MKLDSLRHEKILGRLSTDQKILVADMAAQLGVSMETVRRDLKVLEEHGQLRRVHGGAMPVVSQQDRPLMERSRIAFREKAAIAALVLPMIEPGTSIFLDTGTTTLALARQLGTLAALHVFTNSLDIAAVVGQQDQHKVRVSGGTLRANDNALIGYDTLEFVRRYHFDMAIMGIASVDHERGFMDFEDHEAELRRVLVQQSRLRVVLADHGKFGRHARVRTLDFRSVDRLVTDRAPPGRFGAALSRAGVEVVHG